MHECSLASYRFAKLAVLSCVCRHGCQRAWGTMVLPTCWTAFGFRPVHAWLVGCWPAYVWSVYGRVIVSAAVLLVCGCVSHVMVDVFAVRTFVLQTAIVQSRFVSVVVVQTDCLGVGSLCLGVPWGRVACCGQLPCAQRVVSWVHSTEAPLCAADGVDLWLFRSFCGRPVGHRVPCVATGMCRKRHTGWLLS